MRALYDCSVLGRPRGSFGFALPLALTSFVLVAEIPCARADMVDECATAAETAARELKAGRHAAASLLVPTCARDACPALIRKDCAALSARLEADQASVVVKVTLDGADCRADVSIDGHAAAAAALGREVRLDPGEHRIAATCGESRGTAMILLRTGERLRTIEMKLASPSAEAPAAVEGPARAAPLVVGGFALAALVVGTGVGVATLVRANDLRDTCGTRCAPETVQPVHNLAYVADALFGVSLALAVTSAVLWISAPASSSRATLVLAPSGVGGTF